MDGLLENTVLLHLVDYRSDALTGDYIERRPCQWMAYYTTCPHCGANLDPGERCDCRDKGKGTAPPQQKRPQAKLSTSSLTA